MPQIALNDIMWLAGLLDGDGCFSVDLRKATPFPYVSLSMIDLDTIIKVASLFECSYYEGSCRENERQIYRVVIGGYKAILCMNFVYQYMSIRRKVKIDYITQLYNDYAANNKLRKVQRKRFNLIGSENNIFWIAGILEAEGSFMSPPPSSPNRPIVSLQMTDEDIVLKFAQYFNCKYLSRVPLSKNKEVKYKRIYQVQIRGKKAVELMVEISSLMSERRKNQIKSALNNYNTKKMQEYYSKESKKNKKLFLKDIEEIKKLKESGLSLRRVGTLLNVHHTTLLSFLKKNNVSFN